MSQLKTPTEAANRATQRFPTSNILGATGLPRAVLAAIFRRDGLFGRDSDLSPTEQAVLQSRLPAIDGLKAPAVPAALTPRLAALAAYTEALVAGRDATWSRAALAEAGVAAAAISEVATVVGNVFTVFRPKAVLVTVNRPAPATPAAGPLAHAA